MSHGTALPLTLNKLEIIFVCTTALLLSFAFQQLISVGILCLVNDFNQLTKITDKIQPLLVYCKHADEVKEIINSAKMLRRSSDPVIRNSVFINHNLTKAEALLHTRCGSRGA
jgi:hypothetical protein